MTTTREQWLTIGMLMSVLGALTIFGPWLNIDYYDHYGKVPETFNGFTIFDSGYSFEIALTFPILISIFFVCCLIRFYFHKIGKFKDQKCVWYLVGVFAVVVIFSLWFNFAVTKTITSSHYSIKCGPGWAVIGAICIAFVNMVIAYLADSSCRKNSNSVEPLYGGSTRVAPSGSYSYCPKCGMDLTSQSIEDLSYCPKCGAYIKKG